MLNNKLRYFINKEKGEKDRLRKNIITLSVCALFICTLLFSFLFIATNSEHTHVSDNCHICVDIHQYKTLLNSIFNAGTLYIVIHTLFFITGWVRRFKQTIRSFLTPVLLKVRLLN